MNYQTKVNEKVSKKLQSLSHIPPNRKVGRTGSTGFVLPPMNKGIPEENRRSYTLVLDLDETLVHFDQNTRTYCARPHAHTFVREMSRYYEIVIFTAGLKDYADWILDDFDRCGFIRHRLYRNNCRFRRGVYIKDLSRLGRDLTKTIIIDNIADNFEMQPQNGINILSWYNSKSDTELQKMQPILTSIVEEGTPDVREMISLYFTQRHNGIIMNTNSP